MPMTRQASSSWSLRSNRMVTSKIPMVDTSHLRNRLILNAQRSFLNIFQSFRQLFLTFPAQGTWSLAATPGVQQYVTEDGQIVVHFFGRQRFLRCYFVICNLFEMFLTF